MQNFFSKFSLENEKEELSTVITNIENGVVFRGTNLWVLIFAIFVASLGLNVNSTAVIIGAMLISPLMGPIMGIGLGMGINDLDLLRKSLYNYAIAMGVALATSTLFFLLSPLNDAHSEILARTQPNIYDVLIAFFGGLAGIVAVSSRNKGNVIPGVAIATALMPPLCTAGYGIATLQWKFFIGAFYLFIINTVFIALSTLFIVRLLHFPSRHLSDKKADVIARRLVWVIVLITLLPSIYLGYDLIRQERFLKNAALFIQQEAHFKNDYLLSRKTDAKRKTITLVFGGAAIDSAQITGLRSRLKAYGLDNAILDVKQGFAYLDAGGSKEDDQLSRLTAALSEQEQKNADLQKSIDSIRQQQQLAKLVYREMKIHFPGAVSAVIEPVTEVSDSTANRASLLVLVNGLSDINQTERKKLEEWLKIRLQNPSVNLIIR